MEPIPASAPPRAKPHRTRNKQKTIAALKQAARQQLVTRGIANASIQPILDKANVSRGALFHHFPTKNHLIAAAFEDLLDEAALNLRRLSHDLRLGRIPPETFVAGLRDVFCSELFMGSMEIALANRVEPGMPDLIEAAVQRWWASLRAFWRDTFDLPGRDLADSDQHWVMAANLLRGHAFTTIYRSTPEIRAEFCASFQGMILGEARVRRLTDSFALLAAHIRETVGYRLFTALAVRASEVERVFTTDAQAFPLAGRKRLDDTPWGALVVRQGQTWLGQDASDLARMFPDHAAIARIGCGSCINIPVAQDGQVIGTLNILDAPHSYTPDHVRLAAGFADRARALFRDMSAGIAPEPPQEGMKDHD